MINLPSISGTKILSNLFYPLYSELPKNDDMLNIFIDDSSDIFIFEVLKKILKKDTLLYDLH